MYQVAGGPGIDDFLGQIERADGGYEVRVEDGSGSIFRFAQFEWATRLFSEYCSALELGSARTARPEVPDRLPNHEDLRKRNACRRPRELHEGAWHHKVEGTNFTSVTEEHTAAIHEHPGLTRPVTHRRRTTATSQKRHREPVLPPENGGGVPASGTQSSTCPNERNPPSSAVLLAYFASPLTTYRGTTTPTATTAPGQVAKPATASSRTKRTPSRRYRR